MYIQKLFASKLEAISSNEIAQQLGYQNKSNCDSKIKKLLSSPYLGLESSDYDLKYSTDEFIVRLAKLLNISSLLVEKIIEEIQAELLEQSQKFHSHIYVETFFRRKGQPVFALAFMERARQISITKEIKALNLNQQLSKIQTLIGNHYRSTNGELPMWGTIARYVFYYDENLAIEISTAGKIISASEKYDAVRATLNIGGTPIDFTGKPSN